MAAIEMPGPVVKLTRFHDTETGCRLGYRQDSPANWRVYQSDNGRDWAAVGMVYRTEKELLGDLHRYATESWGF